MKCSIILYFFIVNTIFNFSHVLFVASQILCKLLYVSHMTHAFARRCSFKKKSSIINIFLGHNTAGRWFFFFFHKDKYARRIGPVRIILGDEIRFGSDGKKKYRFRSDFGVRHPCKKKYIFIYISYFCSHRSPGGFYLSLECLGYFDAVSHVRKDTFRSTLRRFSGRFLFWKSNDKNSVFSNERLRS